MLLSRVILVSIYFFQVYMALNNIDAAAESFQKASELEPTDGKEQLL